MVLPPDVLHSDWDCTLVDVPEGFDEDGPDAWPQAHAKVARRGDQPAVAARRTALGV